MRYPQILVYERDGRIAQVLRPLAHEKRWALREPRQAETCATVLQAGDPAVLVIRVGNKVEQELALLVRAHWHWPETRIVVVGEVLNEALATLAWDLGADFVLFPPQPRDLLSAVVVGLMERSMADYSATMGNAPTERTPENAEANE